MKEYNLTEDQTKKLDYCIGVLEATKGVFMDNNDIAEARRRYLSLLSTLETQKKPLEEIKLNTSLKSKYIKILKSGGYRDKFGKVKPPIFINGIPHALRYDIE